MLVAMALSYKVGQAFNHGEDERTVAMHIIANDYLNKQQAEEEKGNEESNPMHEEAPTEEALENETIAAGDEVAKSEVIAPTVITIAGEAGPHAKLMGTYTLVQSRQVNDCPLYYLEEPGNAYLYR